MRERPTLHRYKRAVIFLSAAIISGLPASGLSAPPSDDAYLREIQAEGKKLTPLDRAREEIREAEARDKSAAVNTRAQPTTDIFIFERLLNADAPASFSLYTGLKSAQKLEVFEAYRKNGNLSDAKRRIVDIVLGL